MWVCGRTEKARYLFVILKISRNLGWSWPYQQDNDSTTEFANMLVTSPLRTDCKNMQYRQWDHVLVCITSCQNTGSQWIMRVNNGPLLKCWSYSHCYKEAYSKVYISNYIYPVMLVESHKKHHQFLTVFSPASKQTAHGSAKILLSAWHGGQTFMCNQRIYYVDLHSRYFVLQIPLWEGVKAPNAIEYTLLKGLELRYCPFCECPHCVFFWCVSQIALLLKEWPTQQRLQTHWISRLWFTWLLSSCFLFHVLI